MPLITTEELRTRLGEDDLVVVDCRWYLDEPDRGPAAYAAAHIPGAVHADLDHDLSQAGGPGRHPLPDPATFDATLGRLGIGPASTVVAYDDAGGAVAARLWWMLTDQGHGAAFVLDGGLPAWVDSGGPVTDDVPDPGTGTANIATRSWGGVVTIDEVEHLPRGTVLIDARDPERYRGENEPVDPKAGHIPGAINLPLVGNLTDDRFNTPATITARFAAATGASSNIIVHCGSGVTACHLILAATVAGLPRPRLFVGSWSEWSNTDRPVAIGPAP
ncbi:MAG: sulfurtransferase [Acidimicrobiia bacterium]